MHVIGEGAKNGPERTISSTFQKPLTRILLLEQGLSRG